MEAITESAVRIRLDPSNWPAGLDRKKPAGPCEMNNAIGAAADVFNRYLKVREANAANRNLTPAGVQAANKEWVARNVPTLAERLEQVRRIAGQIESSLLRQLTEEFTKPAIEPQDIALMQEIRSWLRSLPEEERLRRAHKLATEGEKSALRAILTAPTYLTGVSDELLAVISDEAARQSHPDRFAKLEAFRAAAKLAERAVEGVIRYVE